MAGKGWFYESGDWWLYCDVCAKKTKAEESKLRWDGFQVCPDDWETRQPQDFVRAKQDKISVPFARPLEDTSNNLVYGDYDTVYFLEGFYIEIFYTLQVSDLYTIADSATVSKVYIGQDYFSVSDSINIETTQLRDVSDVITFVNSGYVYSYTYTTPPPPDPQTYFAEDYVGLLVNF